MAVDIVSALMRYTGQC